MVGGPWVSAVGKKGSIEWVLGEKAPRGHREAAGISSTEAKQGFPEPPLGLVVMLGLATVPSPPHLRNPGCCKSVRGVAVCSLVLELSL